jgi:positive regulator of sigma E activity
MKGIIYNIEGKTVFIMPEQSGCFGCLAQECSRQPHLIAARNRTRWKLFPGQIVETETAKKSLVKQICSSLLPLLIGFITGYMISGIFLHVSGDNTRMAAGVVGLFIAGFVMYALRKRFPTNGYPSIIRVL